MSESDDREEVIRLLNKRGNRAEADRLLGRSPPPPPGGYDYAPSGFDEGAVGRAVNGGNAVESNLAGPDRNDPSYREARVISEDQARAEQNSSLGERIKKRFGDTDWKDVAARAGRALFGGPGSAIMEANRAMEDRFANRDLPPEKLQPRVTDQQSGMVQGAGPAPEMGGLAPDPRDTLPANPYTQPQAAAPRGGPSGPARDTAADDAQLALMRSGAIGITPERQDAANRGMATLREGAARVDNLSDQMAAGIMAERDASRKIAEARRDEVRERERFMQDRDEVFRNLNANMLKEADTNPDKYWGPTASSQIVSKMAAGVGMLIGGLGGLKSSMDVSDHINKAIDRHVDAQKARFSNRLHMAEAQRKQWNDAYQAFGDTQQAKLAIHATQLEAARNYITGMQSLAKGEDQKMRLLQAADGIDAHLADIKQEQAEQWAKSYYQIRDERMRRQQAAAQAAANRAYAAQEEERRAQRDFGHKKELLGMQLDSKESIADKKASGAGSVGERNDERQAQTINKAQDKIAQFGDATDHVQRLLDKGTKLSGRQSIQNEYAPRWASEWGSSEDEKELMRGIADEARQMLLATGGKALTDSEKAITQKAAEGAGLSFEDLMHVHKLATREYAVSRKAAQALGNERAQEMANKWRERASR